MYGSVHYRAMLFYEGIPVRTRRQIALVEASKKKASNPKPEMER
jgi:hypothetical protein